jgi:hypothetical protein
MILASGLKSGTMRSDYFKMNSRRLYIRLFLPSIRLGLHVGDFGVKEFFRIAPDTRRVAMLEFKQTRQQVMAKGFAALARQQRRQVINRHNVQRLVRSDNEIDRKKSETHAVTTSNAGLSNVVDSV